MNDQTDSQLLRAYAEQRAEPAFAELVRRHVDFVYSAAQRMVCDSHLAKDVTQGVFVALAKRADQLADRPVLSGWLHCTARNIAAQTVRTDVRRRAREQEAVAMNELIAGESEARWEQIAPHLDAALGELGEADRDALLLRYFERKSAQEMAQTLGISDEAAQKRVSRAVERLREFFSKRNVSIGAGALAALISANAVQAAPIGMVATISAAALLVGTAAHTSTVIAATKTIAITTLQKTLVVVTLTAAIGTGIFEARQALKLREQNQALQQAQVTLAEQIRQLQRERDEATNRLAALLSDNAQLRSDQNTTELLKLRGEVTQMRNEANDPAGFAAKKLLAKVYKLKQRLEETPSAKIPELQFLTEEDWLNVASKRLDTDADYRRALASLRSIAEEDFGSMYQQALKKYSQATSGQALTELAQLKTYFDPPVDDAILQRWQVEPAKSIGVPGLGGDWVISEKTAVDDIFDTRHTFGLYGSANAGFLDREIGQMISSVWKAFQEANNGQEVKDISQLLPYATTPEQQAAVQKMILRASANQ